MSEILEVLAILTPWLNDGTNGVNAKLSALPLNTGHARPSNYALIADETTNAAAALTRLPDQANQFPCLLLSAPAVPDVMSPYAYAGPAQDDVVEIVIRHGEQEADAALGSRNALYGMRAVRQSIAALLTATEASRLANGVYLWYAESAQSYPVWQDVGTYVVTRAQHWRFKVRNTTP